MILGRLVSPMTVTLRIAGRWIGVTGSGIRRSALELDCGGTSE